MPECHETIWSNGFDFATLHLTLKLKCSLRHRTKLSLFTNFSPSAQPSQPQRQHNQRVKITMASPYLATIFGNAAKNRPAPEERPSTSVASPTIVITETGDLTVQIFMITPEGHRYTSATGYNVAGKLLAVFKVSRPALARSSPKIEAMLHIPLGQATEVRQDIIDLEFDNVKALEIWFRHFHTSFIDESYQVTIDDIRGIIECSRRYAFSLSKLKLWFAEGMTRNGGNKFDKFTLEELRQLLFPCQ